MTDTESLFTQGMTEGQRVAVAALFDIVAAADVLVDWLRNDEFRNAWGDAVSVALVNYILTRNRYARPGSGHPAPLSVVAP